MLRLWSDLKGFGAALAMFSLIFIVFTRFSRCWAFGLNDLRKHFSKLTKKVTFLSDSRSEFYWFLLDEMHLGIIFACFFYHVENDWRILRHCTSCRFHLQKKWAFLLLKCVGAYHSSMRHVFFSIFGHFVCSVYLL